MRVLALALVAAVLLVPSAEAASNGLTVVERGGARIAFVAQPQPGRALGISGDGRLVSIGGLIVGHVKLPTKTLAWAPTGARAAYVTTQGGIVEWTPKGIHRLEPNGWGATSWAGLAWSSDGALAVARRSELWVIRAGSAHRVVGPLSADPGTGGPDIPEPFIWAGNQVLWWRWPGSGSVAADGVDLYQGGTKLATTLMFPDYVAVCGSHIAYAAGVDRETTDNKKLVFDGRDVSGSPKLSWSTPACTASGRLVAAASRNDPNAFRAPHRAIWQVLPARKQLTRPPWGWSDEDPHFLPNGDLLFVRSRFVSRGKPYHWTDIETGRVMLLAQGKLSQVATIGYSLPYMKDTFAPYYGHYDWSPFLAVSP